MSLAYSNLESSRKPHHRSDHVVQFYETDDYLCEVVADFVAGGLDAHEPIIVIATASHCAEIRRRLVARAYDPSAADWLDADETLTALMVDGKPSSQKFFEVVGERVRRKRAASGGRRLRAFGEMVDILWKAGRKESAIRLEELWNELGASESFHLICGYSLSNFGANEATGFEAVCNAHSDVMVAETDGMLDARAIARLQQRARALEAEVERREALERQLRAREEDLRDFVENGLECIHWVGADGTILFANRAELERLGYTADEYIGRSIREFHVDPDVIDDFLARLSRGESLRDHEARVRCKDGTIRQFLVTSNVLMRDGKFVHTRCFSRDITERKRVEEQLRATAKELEIASRTKDEFLATVSHELRTPLSAIVGWIQMIRGGGLSEAKRERALETIERNAKVQAQLIEDLLDVSRIMSGKLRLDVTSVELAPVVTNAVEALRPTAVAKGVQLAEDLHAGSGTVLGDAGRLQQIVSNLVANAVKFTPKGGVVCVTLQRRDAVLELTVTDTGQGIPAEFLPHVFEQFRQADASIARRHGGLGLGLAIVHSLVELHGATVGVTSEGIGKGATFTVTFPILTSRPHGVEPPPAPSLATTGSIAGLRILLVEDEADSRDVLAEMLTEAQAHVIVAPGCGAALATLKRERPDVVISDIGLPEEDGYSLIRKVRALPAAEGGDTPAIALTAYARFEDRAKALVAGFNLHLPKPVQPNELLAALAGLAATK